ncbi:hypothetical protein D3C79_577610 [compost metagenome]
MGKHFNELVDLLPLARHGRDQRLLLVGHAQVLQERPAQFQVALLLPVVLTSRRLALLLHSAAMEHRLALLAELQLRFVAEAEQVGVAKRGRKQLGHQRQRFIVAQVAGDVAGLVAVDERHAGLALDRQRLGNDALQGFFVADMARQHQLDQGVLFQAGGEQAQKLRTRIRRGLGGGGIGHREKVPRVAEGAQVGAVPGILRGCACPAQHLSMGAAASPAPPGDWATRCARGSAAHGYAAVRRKPRYS